MPHINRSIPSLLWLHNLRSQGYTDILATGFDFAACDADDHVAETFYATSKDTVRHEIVVCQKPFQQTRLKMID